MRRALIPVALAALLACAGCAERMGATPADVTPAAVPRSTPQKPPSKPAAPDRPVVGTGSESSPAASTPPAATHQATASEVPAAADSAYVFAPQQAISARPASSPPVSAPPETPKAAPRDTAPSQPQDESPVKTRGELQLAVVASAQEIATGAIMSVDVMASSSAAVVDAPLHLTFDPNVVEFVDGAPGDFLTQGGSSIVFFADGQSRPGDVAVAAGRVEREQGARGAGLLCRVRFRGVRVGTTPVLVGQAKAWGTRGEELTVLAGGTTVVVH